MVNTANKGKLDRIIAVKFTDRAIDTFIPSFAIIKKVYEF